MGRTNTRKMHHKDLMVRLALISDIPQENMEKEDKD